MQAHGAVPDFKVHQVLIQRGVFVQREVVERQLAPRTQRVELEKPSPRNLCAGVGGTGEGIGIFVVRISAEIVQRHIQRTQDALERRARRQVGERGGGAEDLEPVNSQCNWLGGFLWWFPSSAPDK